MSDGHLLTGKFDTWAKTYEDSWLQRVYFDPIHRQLLDLVKGKTQPKRILDIGCGTGRLLRKARARWPRAKIIGVDSSREMVKVARRLMPDAKFYFGRAESLPLPSASIDVAFSSMSFHHWSDQPLGIREIGRVLRRGGSFYLADINQPPLLSGILMLFNPNNPHFRTGVPSRVQGMFAKAGLEMEFEKTFWRRFEMVGRKR